MEFKNKRITILGLGKSGFESALTLNKLGAIVRVSDLANTELLRAKADILKKKGIEIELGKHSIDLIINSDLVIASPGIKSDSVPIKAAKGNNINVISEIELGYLLCPAPIVAITGSNAKTTVATLVGEVLKLTGKNVFVCGNIGSPFTKYVVDMKKDDLVSLEVSSFQLENIIKFKPKVAVFLNFNRNHLDRHSDMQEYFNMKKRIFGNQDSSDFAVLNFASPEIRALAKELKSKIIYFNQGKRPDSKWLSNPNYLAVVAVGSIFGIDNDKCIDIFRRFKGIEHRLELVKTINGIDFINDSKATTVDAAMWALDSLDKPIIMIAGGRDKGADFSIIKDLLKNKVKELILIGEAKEKISKAVDNVLPVRKFGSLEEAVSSAFNIAKNGDCVLLSPMCASFDMFTDFEERGRIFKSIVNSL